MSADEFPGCGLGAVWLVGDAVQAVVVILLYMSLREHLADDVRHLPLPAEAPPVEAPAACSCECTP